MNPYESTNPTFIKDTSIRSRESERIGVYLIQSLLILSLVACLFYDSVHWVRNWARPRFGSVGLFFIGNPVILLMLRKPSRVAFVLSALMILSMGFLSARLGRIQIGLASNQPAPLSTGWCVDRSSDFQTSPPTVDIGARRLYCICRFE